MACVLVAYGASVGWAHFTTSEIPHVSDGAIGFRTYSIRDGFCDAMLHRLHEDRMLSWTDYDCDDVDAIVRRAFSEWQSNSRLLLSQVPYGYASDIVVASATYEGDSATLGRAHAFRDRPARNATIFVDNSECWYADRAFCHFVVDNYVMLWIALGGVFALAVILTSGFVLRAPRRRLDVALRFVAWAMLFAPPILAVGGALPCVECYDLQTVITHEIGHALGLDHPDAPGASATVWCGCGDAARPGRCEDLSTLLSEGSRRSVMKSTFRHANHPCLARDDVDAVRTLWGGDCGAPVYCQDETSWLGIARVAIALLYSVGAAWLITLLRALWVRYRAQPPAGARRAGVEIAAAAPRVVHVQGSRIIRM